MSSGGKWGGCVCTRIERLRAEISGNAKGMKGSGLCLGLYVFIVLHTCGAVRPSPSSCERERE